MLLFYIKSCARSLARNRIFAALNIGGLAVGLCVFLLTLEYYSFQRNFNQFHPNIASLYRLNVSAPQGISANSFAPIAPLIQKNIPGVKAAVRFADNFNDNAVLEYAPSGTKNIKSIQQDGCVFVDSAFLSAFNFPLVAGSAQFQNNNTALITATTAKKFFAYPSQAVGKILNFHNQFGILPLTITGVLADPPQQSDIQFTCLLPITILDIPWYTQGSDWAKLTTWDNDSYTTYLWLNKLANPADVAAKASKLWAANDPGYKPEKGRLELQPLSQVHMGKNLLNNNPTFASLSITYLILGLGVLLLCIAWINYINFSTAYSLSQAKQIGIHKIVGSTRRQIVLKYVVESALLNIVALCLAAALAQFVQPLFNYFTGKPLALRYINQLSVWAVGAATVGLGIALCGGYVGFILAGFKPVTMMHFNKTGGLGNVLLRRGLVIFQFWISAVFIAATIIAYMQINYMRHYNLGIKVNNTVVVAGPVVRDSTFKVNKTLFRDEVKRLPFVEKLSLAGSVPGVGFAHNFSADGITGGDLQKGDDQKSYFITEADENYFPMFGVPMVSGENFSSADADEGFNCGKVIVNETAARMLHYEPASAAGQAINWGKRYVIKGVVKDYHHRSLKDAIEPIIYVPLHNNNKYVLRMNLGNLPQKMGAVQAIYQKLYPGNPFEFVVLKDTFDSLYADEQKAGSIATSVSVLVVIVASLGLVGLSVFSAKRRLKEMGIRKVLGASSRSLFLQLVNEFLKLVVIAFIIAIPVAYVLMNKWLQSFPYRISLGLLPFALTGLAVVLIAVFTVSIQALKTACVSPAGILRNE